jgi:hypothetical protein
MDNITHKNHIKCIRKVFRSLYFFQMLLCYSLVLKWIKLFFSPSFINLHTIPHNDKAIKLLFFKTEISDLHKYSYSPILLWRSSQALSGWMGSVTAKLFSGLSRDVWSGSSPVSGWATHGHSKTCPEATPALSWLCCLGSLSCWKVNLHPSLRSWVLWSRFIKDLSVWFQTSSI